MEECKECINEGVISGKTCRSIESKIVPKFREMIFKRLIPTISEIGKTIELTEDEMLFLCRGKDLSHDQLVLMGKFFYYWTKKLNRLKDKVHKRLLALSLLNKKSIKKMGYFLEKSKEEILQDLNSDLPTYENEIAKYWVYTYRIIENIKDKMNKNAEMKIPSAEEWIRLTHLAADYCDLGFDNGTKFITDKGELDFTTILNIEKEQIRLAKSDTEA